MPDWLVAEGLCYAHGDERPLLDTISLRIAQERVALIGGNGVGKTTLLRLLTGELRPERGHVARRGHHFYWPQQSRAGERVGTLLPMALADRGAALARFNLPATLPAALPLASLSGGQVARVRLAAITATRPDLLILDEPGNDLDEEGRRLLTDLMRGWRGGLLLVSHERHLLSLADRILDLGPKGLRSHGGGLEGWLTAKAAEQAAAERALADADKQVRRVTASTREAEARADRRARAGKRDRERGSNAPVLMGMWRGNAESAASARRMRAERQTADAKAALEEARRRLPPPRPPLHLAIPPTGLSAGQLLLRADGISLTRGGRSLWRDLSFTLAGPERVAITGINGAGKSSLLDVLAGTVPADGGTVERARGLRLARLDQRLLPRDRGTPLDLMRTSHPDQPEQERRAALARFGFRAEQAEVPMAALSGGMLVRACLCVVLAGPRPPNLLLLDEPTNHLDLEGLEALRQTLLAYDGALVLVCHDAEFRQTLNLSRTVAL